MKSLFLAMLALVFGAVTASAEQPAAWPGNRDITVKHSSTAPRKPVAAKTYNIWSDPFVPYAVSITAATGSDKGGQFPTPAKELDAQQKAFRHYWYSRHRELTAGGEWADVLPVRVHERLNAQAFGTPVMSGNN